MEDQVELLTKHLTAFDSFGQFFLGFVVIAVIPGIGEELLFRGLIQNTLQKIFSEGVENRFQRHANLNQMVHQWVADKGFELLPKTEFASKSLTCVRNNLDIDVAGFVKKLREERKISIDGGYGKIKGKTFRISNMGDETEDSINHLLSNMDEVLSQILPA